MEQNEHLGPGLPPQNGPAKERTNPADPAALERLRARTAMAALTAAVLRADRERFRAALRRDQERGGKESMAAVRKLLDQGEEAG